jgi:hypothetical protein
MSDVEIVDVSSRKMRQLVVLVTDLRDVLVVAAQCDRAFGLYVALESAAMNDAEKQATAKTFIGPGCRSFWFAGPDNTSWEDAADRAVVAISLADSPTSPYDLRMARTSGTVMTVAGSYEEVLHFFRHDMLMPPIGPLTARIFVTDSATLEKRAIAAR